jgi:glycosyltransferase involved in cell wall biosynthesis
VVFAPVGGLERVVVALAAAQRTLGHEVTVAACIAPGSRDSHPFVTELRRQGVPVEPLTLPGRAYFRERELVGRLCDRLRPGIVHTHGYRPDVLHGPVARRRAIATVSTVHGFTGGDWKNRLFEYLDRRALRRFAAVVTVSRVQLEQLHADGVPADRLTQIPNAWAALAPPLERAEARLELGLPADGFALGWVGRLSGEKGPDVFLEALSRLTVPGWTAAVLGDGPDRAALGARAGQLGLGGRIHWPGVVPDAARLYRAFDVFVLSSRTEGIPIVLFEAMHAVVPIVATRVGGVGEVVGDGEALLVPALDPAALAAAIDKVAEQPQEAARRAAAALSTLERRFAPRPWVDAYDVVYRQAIARAAAR